MIDPTPTAQLAVMKPVAALCLAASLMLIRPSGASAHQLTLGSSGIKATIDVVNGRLMSITHLATGEVYTISSDTCRIVTTDGTIEASGQMKLVSKTKSSCEFIKNSSGLKITRTYTLPQHRAYLNRELRITNVTGHPIVLKTITDCALAFSTPFQSAAFHTDNMDQCDAGSEKYSETEKPSIYQTSINVFMRTKQGGLYAGLKYPYFTPNLSPDHVALSYETNYRLKPGETLELPTMFAGAYENTGYICRKELNWTPRILSTEQEILDIAEVRAMQQVMRDYLPEEPCPRPGYFMWLNSWWANAELRGKWSSPEAEAFRKLCDNVKQSKCLDMISTAPIWCGWANFIAPCEEIDTVGDNAIFPRNKAMDRAMTYAPFIDLPASGFCEPNSLERHYRKDRPDWKLQPTQDESKTLIQNCHANEAYENWFFRLTCGAIDTYKLSGWAWDHSWVRRPMLCYGKNHGHEPGNCEFQQYKNITNLITRLRRRYPDLFMEIYWGLKEAGPWSLRGLNSLENAYENNSPAPPGMTAADDLRFQHWFNHNYRFIPTYMDMAQMNFKKEANGHLYSLLSCLSASTHASLCDWTPFKTDQEADEIFGLMRKWKAWATDHMPYLRDRIDLFGMPCRNGGIDGTAHIIKDRGFIFIFNPTANICYGSIPLNEMIGLSAGTKFAVDEISMGLPKPIGVYAKNSELAFQIAPKSALLFELRPSKGTIKHASIPSGVTVQPAFIGKDK